MERVCKDIVKAFPKELDVKQLEKHVIGLLGYQV